MRSQLLWKLLYIPYNVQIYSKAYVVHHVVFCYSAHLAQARP